MCQVCGSFFAVTFKYIRHMSQQTYRVDAVRSRPSIRKNRSKTVLCAI